MTQIQKAPYPADWQPMLPPAQAALDPDIAVERGDDYETGPSIVIRHEGERIGELYLDTQSDWLGSYLVVGDDGPEAVEIEERSSLWISAFMKVYGAWSWGQRTQRYPQGATYVDVDDPDDE